MVLQNKEEIYICPILRFDIRDNGGPCLCGIGPIEEGQLFISLHFFWCLGLQGLGAGLPGRGRQPRVCPLPCPLVSFHLFCCAVRVEICGLGIAQGLSWSVVSLGGTLSDNTSAKRKQEATWDAVVTGHFAAGPSFFSLSLCCGCSVLAGTLPVLSE